MRDRGLRERSLALGLLAIALELAACGSSPARSDGSTGGAGGGSPPSAARGVYLLGTTSPGACGGDALERIWPTRATSYYTGFDCYATLYQFRTTDDQLFYDSLNMGMRVDGAGATDAVWPTPPCADEVDENFGFDGQGRLHYLCINTLMRGDGETIATNVGRLFGVLADGRTIVANDLVTNTAGAAYQVLGPDGAAINLLVPDPAIGGIAGPIYKAAATTAGNDAYALVGRFNDPQEVLLYHLDPQSHWELLRTVVGPDPTNGYFLALPDGTVLNRRDDSTSGNNHVVAYPPGSDTPQEIWKSGDSPTVVSHTGVQLLMGPLEATGPSVQRE
jgi:hypothetical protein